MYQYLVANPVLAVIFIVLIIAVVVFLAVKAIQKIGLEKIRAVVYQGFLKAEHEFQYGDNTQKFEYVIQLARSSIPAPFNMFITESLLRKVVQLWFDLIKDLLDDWLLLDVVLTLRNVVDQLLDDVQALIQLLDVYIVTIH